MLLIQTEYTESNKRSRSRLLPQIRESRTLKSTAEPQQSTSRENRGIKNSSLSLSIHCYTHKVGFRLGGTGVDYEHLHTIYTMVRSWRYIAYSCWKAPSCTRVHVMISTTTTTTTTHKVGTSNCLGVQAPHW